MNKLWSDHELTFAVLHVLLDRRKKQVRDGGAGETTLINCLHVDSTDQMRRVLTFLANGKLIEGLPNNFTITVDGVDYLQQHGEPPEPETNQALWPGTGGPDRPDKRPDDPSGVPLRPKPSNDGTLAKPKPPERSL